jgi:UDP-N-acetylglucosamine 2-epimerase (non-hydrolysing)
VVAIAADLLQYPDRYAAMANAVNPFGDGKAAERIEAIAHRYLTQLPTA